LCIRVSLGLLLTGLGLKAPISIFKSAYKQLLLLN
jgi:hypothetical protein